MTLQLILGVLVGIFLLLIPIAFEAEAARKRREDEELDRWGEGDKDY